ncbi:Crp/Fnr family transcriptional regulator [Campylobacter iguaniorum]|uniref:Crp/Fnr family transcriptional regulator n=1 Tax=Campylobacter iguaniorum TaxID=1244531 RepID=UPI0007C8D747|nr:Crp/Fnr family transcriptional regulator [Campylobacter iguaniorum]
MIRNKFKAFNLSDEDINLIEENASYSKFNKGQVIYQNKKTCYGFIIVKSGNLRGFILSDNAREITVFSLKQGDECILCSNCISNSLQLEISLEAKDELCLLIIPSEIFSKLKQKYIKLSNFVLELLSKRFTSSINVMQQALFLPLSQRIKKFLKENAVDNKINLTHEDIANNLGSAREAVSRILKEMEKAGDIKLLRSEIILNKS